MTYTYGNYGTTTTSYDGAGLAVFGALWIVYMLICIAIAVVTIIGMWKVFTKAGEEGWKSLIPVYNMYTLCKIIGVSPWWILITFVGGLVCIIPILGYLAYMAATIYFGILVAKSTANAFGKDTGFAVGLYFLGPIFYCILGFGKAKYEGAKPMNDIIFKNNK
jgi:hypothetical protein